MRLASWQPCADLLRTRKFDDRASKDRQHRFCTVADMAGATDTRALAAPIEGRCDPGGGERGSATYCPATISNGDTQVTGSCTLLHLGQVRTCVPVRRLPSPERQSETVICHELTQERPGLQ
jgi:hypothetical protein